MSSTSPRSMWNTISSNPMPRSALSFSFFASSHVKYFTAYVRYHDVCLLGTHARLISWGQFGEGRSCFWSVAVKRFYAFVEETHH